MQVVLSEPIRDQISPICDFFTSELPPEPVLEEPSLQWFCQLQIEQLMHHIPDICIRFVYQCPKRLKRKTLIQGTEFWSLLDADVQTYLESESWWSSQYEPNLREIFEGVQQRFYVYPLNRTKREYLLLGTCRPLSAKQKQFVEGCAKLLAHHISTVQELNYRRDSEAQIKQNNHHIEHQLRNPIALIEIYTKILLSLHPNGQSRSQLELIQTSIQEISRHLKQLNVTETTLQIELCDLRNILAESLQQLQPWLHEKQVTIEQSQTPAILEVDAWQLKQVFENLLSNAIHFSPQAGTIGCTWQVFQHEILIEVWDQGAGLSETDLQFVFTPFYSRRPGGTGLGLSIAEKIITAHHGRLWVNNLPGKGAKFSFSLPIRHSHSWCAKFLEKDSL